MFSLSQYPSAFPPTTRPLCAVIHGQRGLVRKDVASCGHVSQNSSGSGSSVFPLSADEVQEHVGEGVGAFSENTHASRPVRKSGLNVQFGKMFVCVLCEGQRILSRERFTRIARHPGIRRAGIQGRGTVVPHAASVPVPSGVPAARPHPSQGRRPLAAPGLPASCRAGYSPPAASGIRPAKG